MKTLAHLSGKSIDEVEKTISKLENLSGFSSHDVRSIAESNNLLRSKIRQLGLDPDDTTAEELHYGLISKYKKDSELVEKAIGLDKNSTIEERIKKSIELADHFTKNADTWGLKTTSAKNILKANPPKKLMKRLGYRSTDSLLKRESVFTIFVSAHITESRSWHTKLANLAAKLDSTHYEVRRPKIVLMSNKLEFKELILSDNTVAAIGLSELGAKNNSALYIALCLSDAVSSLGEQTHKPEDLASANVALSWWKDTAHLLMPTKSKPVSLNIRDVAINHANELTYSEASREHGHKAFWDYLMSRYKESIGDLPSELRTFEQKFSVPQKPLELAFESVEA